ncbi:MAG TPA: hypothetical protein VN950_21725 [Terriglobales bacterium]|nr:hypothetical protein [Terriglobales bacterium]
MELLTNHIACIYAGGVATDLLEPGGSAINRATAMMFETQDDLAEIERIVSGSIQNEQQRSALKDRALARSTEWISGESAALLAMRSALVESGVLDGTVAERIIRTALSSTRNL